MTKARELADIIANVNHGSSLANKNFIINGAMNVAQRGTSATGVGSTNSYPTVDRFKVSGFGSTAGRLTMEQSTDHPSGFSNSVKLTCTTADTSIGAGEGLTISQDLEGQDLQQLKKGTGDAVPITVSFWVKGNASATYTCELRDADNSRFNSQAFSVTTSWNRIELTFAGDTSGVLDNDTSSSLQLFIWLHAGSTYTGGTHTSNAWHTTANQRVVDSQTSFCDSTSRTFFITGVQMEVGEKATEFEHEPIGATLEKCQRYYYEHIRGVSGTRKYVGTGEFYVTTQLNCNISFPTTMRTSPTLVQGNGTDYFGWWGGSQSGDISATWNLFLPSENTTSMYLNPDDDPSASGIGARIYIKDDDSVSGTTNAFLAFNAEL